MSAQVTFSEVINRSVDKVFRFFADEHVRNHPRWDPDIELEQISDGPIGLGTMIRRRNSRSGTPVNGTMEVTEFERNQSMGMLIHDGPVEMRGRVLFEPVGENQTRLTTIIDLPGMDASMDTTPLVQALEQRRPRLRKLMESEIPA